MENGMELPQKITDWSLTILKIKEFKSVKLSL